MRRFLRNSRPAAVASLGVAVALAAASCDWPTYHANTARTGTIAGSTVVRSVSTAWSRGLDGAVYASPVLIGSTLVVATENNTLYGLDAPSGTVRWSRHLATPVTLSQLAARGAPCGNINPLGITGTPAYDGKRVFAVAETLSANRVVHQLFSVDPANGAVAGPVTVSPPTNNPAAHQQRGALTVLNGRVYVPFGGLAGDCGDYRGSVVSRSADLAGTNTSYTIPTAREAGIWTPPGATVTPSGTLLVTAGNGATTLTGAYDGSDAVIELRPGLGAGAVAARFTPADWRDDNLRDLDLGSSGPSLVSSGGNDYVVQSGKRGIVYVLRRAGLVPVARTSGCAAFGGSAVAGPTVYEPCSDGVRAIGIGANGAPTIRWKANGGGLSPAGSPVVYQASVLALDPKGGRLYALNAATGVATTSIAVGSVTRFATPALDTGRAYVGTTGGIVAVNLK